ncbi:hypothetical protein DB347_06765 [Opitutaceae bacterium EW11]|nr:hypothetical protein DB347_06765 [Opitutaceae bacterium EW11]
MDFALTPEPSKTARLRGLFLRVSAAAGSLRRRGALVCVAALALPLFGTPPPARDWHAEIHAAGELADRNAGAGYAQTLKLRDQLPPDASSEDRFYLLQTWSYSAVLAGHSDEALQVADQALQLARSVHNSRDEGVAECRRAMALSDLGRLDEALETIDRSLELLEKAGDQQALASCLVTKSQVHGDRDELDAVASVAARLIALSEQMRDPHLAVFAHDALGNALLRSKRYGEAAAHFNTMLELLGENGAKYARANALEQLGMTIGLRGDRPRAEGYFRRALALRREVGEVPALAATLSNLATNLKNQKRPKEALPLLDEAIQLHVQSGVEQGRRGTLLTRSEVRVQLGDLQGALQDAETALVLSKKIGVATEIAGAAETVAETAAAAGDYRRAYEAQREAAERLDTASRENVNKRVAELEQHYAAEHRQREIADLEKRATAQSAALEHRGLIQRFLLVLLGLSLLAAAVASWLLLRLRRAHRALGELNDELVVARQNADAASRAKSEFLATMSHEIRTPMNGVLGLCQILRNTQLDSEQREYVELIQYSGDSMLAIINDILDFSKIEAGMLALESIDFCLPDLIEDTLQVVAHRAREKHLDLCFLPEPDLPSAVRGDPVRLQQIILNLVGNAVKFTARGEVAVSARGERRTDGRTELRIEVRDTGVGMSEDVRRRLFQPFTQADSSTTRRFGGTGLGLAISRRLVELMGGKIGVESTPGAGSTFWFSLVLEPVTCGETSIGSPNTRQSAPNLGDSPVLIVDGSASQRRALGLALDGLRAPHQAAASGAEAVERLRSAAASGRPFRYVLLDGNVSGAAELTTARSSAEPALFAGAKVILLACTTQRPTPDQLSMFGVSACLLKPVRQAVLLNALLNARDAGKGGANRAVPEIEPVFAGRGWHVLLAEDNAVNQKVALTLLKCLGVSADLATSGTEALQILERHAYDALLLDIHMPELDGYEVARRLRASPDPHQRSLPIIAMTADAMSGDREKCLAAGMNDYVSKPVVVGELRSALHRQLELRPATAGV